MKPDDEEITAHQVIQNFADRAGIDFKEAMIKLEKFDREWKRLKQPKPIANPDWSKVIEMANAVMLSASNNTENDDDPQYMIQEVMQAVYGKDYYRWANNAGK